MRLILVLHNIRSTYNVGAILRTAEGLGVERVVLSGYTPATKWANFSSRGIRKGNNSSENGRRPTEMRFLPHILEKTTNQIAKTALGAEKLVTTEFAENIMERINELASDGWVIMGLENNITDNRLHILGETGLDLGDKVVLVLGEEVAGIPEELYHQMDIFLEIPMKGKKESFNVSVAAGIAMWELLK